MKQLILFLEDRIKKCIDSGASKAKHFTQDVYLCPYSISEKAVCPFINNYNIFETEEKIYKRCDYNKE